MTTETYLGDGLYASFDGWIVQLRAPREDGDHWIGLEPDVLKEFLTWLKDKKIVHDDDDKAERLAELG